MSRAGARWSIYSRLSPLRQLLSGCPCLPFTMTWQHWTKSWSGLMARWFWWAMRMRGPSSLRRVAIRVKALVYITALVPDQGETVADVFYRYEHDEKAPKLAPGSDGWIRLPKEAFATAFAQHATKREQSELAANPASHFAGVHHRSGRSTTMEDRAHVVSRRGARSHDSRENAAFHGSAHEGSRGLAPCRSPAKCHCAAARREHHCRRASSV